MRDSDKTLLTCSRQCFLNKRLVNHIYDIQAKEVDMQQSVCKLAFSVYGNIVFHEIHIFSNDRHAFYVEGIIEFYKCVAYAINMGDLT